MEESINYDELIEKRKNPNGDFYSTLRFLLVLLAILFCVTITFTQIFNGVVVFGDSMLNTLHNGDYLYMQINYSSLEHGDIIVVDSHEKTSSGEEKYLIKRLIGLPGDSLYNEGDKLYRKNAGTDSYYLVEENYLDPDYCVSWGIEKPVASKTDPLVLKENEIFFMGDNRNDSEDSRGHYRSLQYSDVVGVVTPWSIACKGFLTALFNIF